MKTIYKVCEVCGGKCVVEAAFFNGMFQYYIPMDTMRHTTFAEGMSVHKIACSTCESTGRVLWGWIEE